MRTAKTDRTRRMPRLIWVLAGRTLILVLSCRGLIIVKRWWAMLHIEVRLPVLLCAVKTVEGDFRSDMYIEWYIQTVQQITRTLIHKNQFTSLCRGQKPASKCNRLVYEILVICRVLQALFTPQRCELMKKKEKKKTLNCSYRIFIVCRLPVSPVF